jgi:anaerobic magnesium-protoporphyrin IX monomethyl ester cyclase
MDILLIASAADSHYTVPPVGLGYLGTALKKNGFDVSILDRVKSKMNHSVFKNYISRLHLKAVGFQVFSCDMEYIVESVKIVKNLLPDVIVIAGGSHPTCAGKIIFNEIEDLDFAFQGEGEIGLPMLLKKIINGEDIHCNEIPNLMWKENNDIIINKREFIDDLDSLGFPSWDLIRPDTYPRNPQGAFYKNFPIAPIVTSRGCPFNCTFCASNLMMGRKLRLRSIDNVIEEIKLLYIDYGIREFNIIDDNFTYYPDRVKYFCRKIQESGMTISLSFPNGVRLDTLDEELLDMLHQIGTYALTVGIESGSQRILDAMRKNLDIHTIEEKINLINRSGIDPGGFFIIGFPGETKEDIQKTISFAKKLKITKAQFSNFMPLPGTHETNNLIEEGKISKIGWASLFYSRVAYCPDGITTRELKQMQRKAFLGFYLRPKILFKMLSEIKSFYHLKTIAKRAKDYLFKKYY